MEKVKHFFHKEPVLSIAAAAAAASMLLVPPNAGYIDYIDVRVLCLLFCLMAVVLGFRSCGLFTALAKKLLSGCESLRKLAFLLVMLPFFSSMLVTNDVALITFVPFAILVLDLVGRRDLLIRVVTLQTVAANLGSMATPVGNPQNLFLYAAYELSAGAFFAAVLPLTAASFVLLTLAMLWIPKGSVQVNLQEGETLRMGLPLAAYGVLFVLCLLSVFHVVPYYVLTVIVAAAMFALDKKLLKDVDYGLLVTFVCFFVFAGNMGELEAVRTLLTQLLSRSALLSSALASQVISNVPAAVLLSGFTTDWKGLLLGVNVGGLGTLIASLASLISFRFYAAEKDSSAGKYLLVFTLVNVIGLVLLVPMALLCL